jgi:hypothetical protein
VDSRVDHTRPSRHRVFLGSVRPHRARLDPTIDLFADETGAEQVQGLEPTAFCVQGMGVERLWLASLDLPIRDG